MKAGRINQKVVLKTSTSLLTISCFSPTKDCSTELALRTRLWPAAFSPRKRSIRSLTASPWKEGRKIGWDNRMLINSANQTHN
jgi:hypothetical protein